MNKWFLFLSSLLVLLTSCSHLRNSENTTLQIRATRETNHGTPLYVVIKETTITDFLLDDYHKITSQMFGKDSEKNYLTKQVIIPGSVNTITIEKPNKEKSLGLYFIFTTPDECWKYIVDQPHSKRVSVLLGTDQYQAIDVY